ncbi:MAG: MFS transporter [Dehalococcoidia bacterium]
MRLGTTPLWKAALQIYIPSFLMMLGQGMIFPALPLIGREFDIPSEVAIQAVTALLVGKAVSTIPAGAIIDKWGTKGPMVAGASITVVSGLTAALAPGFAMIVVAQFLWGVGMNIWMFGREVAAVEMVRVEQRGRQMGILMGMGSTGMAMGPVAGGVLADTVGITGLFFGYAAVGAAVLGIALTHREPGVRHERSKTPLFNFGAVKQVHPYFRITFFILFIATLTATVRSQATNTILPLYAQDQLAYSATQTGIVFSVIGIVTFIMIVPAGVISDRFGRKWPATGSALLAGIAFVLFPMVESILALSLVGVIIGVANGFAQGVMTTYTYDIVPNHAKAQLQALRRTFSEIGGIATPVLSGVVAASYGGSGTFWFWAPLQFLAAALLILVAKESLPRKRPKDLDQV